jgi:hypothetical protein
MQNYIGANLPRLYPLKPHPVQLQLASTKARFVTVPAGRRSGKTERAKRKVIVEAIRATGYPDPRFFAAAPTRDQAKAIYWADLKAMIPRKLLREHPRESELVLRLWNGSEIYVIGMDKPERIEGRPWSGGILDEYANMKEGAWGENVRPALSDRKGWCWLIGVPEGRNHYHDMVQYAQSGDPEWANFTWPSADILDPEEIEAARRQLDPLVFAQEYEASFVNFTGRAYYPFLDSSHCASLRYNPLAPLILCFDFNVEPGVCAIVQEQELPGQFERDSAGLARLDRPIFGTGVIGEVHIPHNSSTPAVCRKVVKDWGGHLGSVRCYGDASGGARGSAKVAGSDWELIKTELRPIFKDRLHFKVKRANPPERSRVNAVNSRLQAGNGEIRLMVDRKASNVIKDLEGVRLLEGGSGEIDKAATKKLTHISDALGYYIEYEFPTAKRTAVIEDLVI